jgi:hypothetical protein
MKILRCTELKSFGRGKESIGIGSTRFDDVAQKSYAAALRARVCFLSAGR